jgi:hypothetical protein
MMSMRGWLTDAPPPPPRDYHPGEEHKWYKMMGAAHLLPRQESFAHGTANSSQRIHREDPS